MNSNIVRAWKDEFYRESLSDEERAQLPENPVGELELTDAELGSVFAGRGGDEGHTYGPCADISFIRGGCHTRFPRECIVPNYSFDFDDCRSYRYDTCHHFSYRDSDDCRTYKTER